MKVMFLSKVLEFRQITKLMNFITMLRMRLGLFGVKNGIQKVCITIPGKDDCGTRFQLDKIRKLLVQIRNSNSGNLRVDRENNILIHEFYQVESSKRMVLTFLFNGKKVADISSDTVVIQNRFDMATQTEKTLFKACFERMIVIILDYFGIE